MWKSARVYTEPLNFTRGKLRRSGFTLVELLVVIAIISILSSIGLTVYSSAQKNARISKRTQDLKAIEAALEIYYQANNAYPSTGGNTTLRSQCAIGGSRPPDDVIRDVNNNQMLTPNYMAVFPQDPRMDAPNNTSCYIYISDGIDYKIYDNSVTEMTQADYAAQRALIDPRRDASNSCGQGVGSITAWAVYTSGARCW